MKKSNQHDFFAGIEQVDVWAAGNKVKLPIFYRDARASIAIFPASIFALKKLLPDPRFVPAQLVPGIGAIGLACLEYYDTDVGPYNEFAFTIMLNNPNFLQIPGYNLTRQLFQLNFYPYIYHLPVTTEQALRWGIDFSGFPKFLSSIGFEETPEQIVCELKEKDELICKLSGRKIHTPLSALMKLFIRLYQYSQPQHTEFKVNARQMGISLNPGTVKLEIGHTHPIALELRRTLLLNRSIMYFYLPSVQFILYGPENISLPLMNFLFQKGMRIELDQLKKPQRGRKKKEQPSRAHSTPRLHL